MWQKCLNWLKGLPVQDWVLLTFAFAFSVTLYSFVEIARPADAQRKFYVDWNFNRAALMKKQAAAEWAPPDATAPTAQESRDASKATLERLMTRRLEALRRAEGKVSRNLYLHGLALILAFVVVFGRSRRPRRSRWTKLPFLDIEVPVVAICIVLPLALLWLWVDFGFALALAIDLRASLWHLISAEGGLPPESLLSTQIALRDGGFLDIWFNAYRDEIPKAMNDRSLEIAKTVGTSYGMFFGLVHAAIFALLSTGIAGARCKPLGKSVTAMVLGGALMWFLLACHGSFMLTGQPQGPQRCTAVATACFVIVYLVMRPRRTSPTRTPKAPLSPADAPAAPA